MLGESQRWIIKTMLGRERLRISSKTTNLGKINDGR
jgi:hypothetical protein